MSNNNTLPEDLQATIKDAAETYAGLKAWIDKDGMEPQLFYEYIAAQSHIAGATEYAPYKVKYERLLKMYEEDTKRNMCLNMPGVSEIEQEETWQNFKRMHNL